MTPRGRAALLTGATGFVGGHLAQALLRDGWTLHLVVRQGSDTGSVREIAGSATLHRHDGSTASLVRIVSESRPDVVFHLASLFVVQHAPADVEPLVRSNVLFPTQLLDAMAAAGIHRLVNTGTTWQHYNDRDYSPVNLYAATKQALDAILQYYVEATPLKAITLKLTDTYGPRDTRKKLFSVLRAAARERRPLAMSPGDQLIDLVYIDDAVKAFLVAGERLLSDAVTGHETYAVSSGRPVRLRDLVERYTRVTGIALQVEWGIRPYRPREMMIPWRGGAPLPGWNPSTSLEEGLRNMECL